MLETEGRTFPLFPRLHTEIRLLIWEFYFASPRIHIIEQALPDEVPEPRPWSVASNWSEMTDEEEIKARPGNFLTWTTIEPATNERLESHFRTDINREARFVAEKLGGWSLIPSAELQDPTPHWEHDGYEATLIYEGRIDVNWAVDLLYVYEPKSIFSLMGVTRFGFTQNIQHIAFAAPWACPAPDPRKEPLGLSFPCNWLSIAPKFFERLRTITVVTMPPEAATHQDAEAILPSVCPRDACGFTTVKAYHKQSTFRYNSSTIIEDTRVALGTKREFNYHFRRRKEKLVVNRVVDVDFMQAEDGKYSRRLRI
ncbi:hypothetical protein PWT90_02435 [Aphanocladium album]|nr:hypothetical protein PWT90_02435 [Aphanocladium album]